MSEGGLRAFDLKAPTKSLWAPEPYPCPVCGKSRPGVGRVPIGYRQHDDCDRQILAWERQIAKAADADPVYLISLQDAEDARVRADAAWTVKARSLGLPEWVVERAIASHREGWHDE